MPDPTAGAYAGTRRFPRYVWRAGRLFWSMPALADRWGVTRQRASAFAHAHPGLTVTVGAHIYCEDRRT